MHTSRKTSIRASLFFSQKYFRLNLKRQKEYLKLSASSEYDLQQEAVNKLVR